MKAWLIFKVELKMNTAVIVVTCPTLCCKVFSTCNVTGLIVKFPECIL